MGFSDFFKQDSDAPVAPSSSIVPAPSSQKELNPPTTFPSDSTRSWFPRSNSASSTDWDIGSVLDSRVRGDPVIHWKPLLKVEREAQQP